MKYEYRVTQPDLRPGATSPVMGDRDVEEWLNEMSERGWEFVGCGVHFWHDMLAQQHWVFRRERGLTKHVPDARESGAKIVKSKTKRYVKSARG